jgi:retron-type reverse transcriptase
VTAKQYTEHLDDNLRDLHERLRRGRYQAAPVERVWIEKDDGGQRPIGKPAFEDKIVQRAVAMLLEAIYEQDFHDGSYGFRQGRSPHEALRALRERCMTEGIGWIVDADVSGYFDSIDRAHLRDVLCKRVNDGRILRLIGKWLRAGVLDEGVLRYPESGVVQGGVISPVLSNLFLHHVLDEWFEREVLRQRVNDGRIMRLIGKWLRAGVMEDGVLQHPETGVVQGGVISPVLANIFLHYVLDGWFEREVQPRLTGKSFLTRFADDWIIGCELEADAQRLMAVLPKRFARFGLSLHPEKTVLIRFRKPTTRKGSGDGNGTFDFLGLTHYWTRSRRGYWVILRRTARKRLHRTKKVLWRWCRANRHLPLKDQHRMLCQKLRGHFQYYGIQGNYRLLSEVRQHAEEAWRYWLSRRSHKSAISWEKFQKLKAVFGLPIPQIVHQI